MVQQNRSGSYSQIVYAPGGSKLAIMSGQSLQKAFVPLLAGAQAVYTSAGLAYYRHPDWLGSSRLASTPARAVYYDGAYAPFGESYVEMGTTSRSFTGQNQDTVTGLYDFMFREYSPVQGRWVSPDPAGLTAVSAANPQSWNRYAYVGNTPLTAVDPLGLFQNDAVGVLFNNNCYINSVVANCQLVYTLARQGQGSGNSVLIWSQNCYGPPDDRTCQPAQLTLVTSATGTDKWWKDFASTLFWTFSAKSARQEGEGFWDCVSRVRGAGGSFTGAVDAVSGVGAINTALTARAGSTTYSVWRVWGGHGWAETTVTARNLSLLEAIATSAVGKGMIPPSWAAGAANWAGATAKVSGIATAVALGLEGGVLGACAF